MLLSHDRGHYRFLKGIAPYSCGVIADPGCEIEFEMDVRGLATEWNA